LARLVVFPRPGDRQLKIRLTRFQTRFFLLGFRSGAERALLAIFEMSVIMWPYCSSSLPLRIFGLKPTVSMYWQARTWIS
jgi:hypothetical protein